MNEQEQQEFADLRKLLRIRIHELHHDAQEQPDLAFRAGELAAEMRAGSKRAKLEVEEVKANTDKSIRDDPESFGLSKVTEGSVQSAIDRNPEVKNLQRVSITYELESDKAAVLAEAYRHRKSMISDEVTLYVANYWGEVEEKQMKKATSDSRGQQEERVNKERRKRRKAKKENDDAQKED